jgi:hypothetical protein
MRSFDCAQKPSSVTSAASTPSLLVMAILVSKPWRMYLAIGLDTATGCRPSPNETASAQSLQYSNEIGPTCSASICVSVCVCVYEGKWDDRLRFVCSPAKYAEREFSMACFSEALREDRHDESGS